MRDGWTKKTKGNAKIYTHPQVFENRAVVENFNGVTFHGQSYRSVSDAKAAALSYTPEEKANG